MRYLFIAIAFLFVHFVPNPAMAQGMANVVSCGADSTGVSDSSSAFASCYSMISSTGGQLIVPPGKYRIATFPTISASGVVVQCVGGGSPSGGAILEQDASSGDFVVISGAAASGIRDCAFQPLQRLTSGYQVHVTNNCYICFFENIDMQYVYQGFKFDQEGEDVITNFTDRFSLYPNAVYFGGSAASAGTAGLTLNHVVTDNPYPIKPSPSDVITWSPSEAVTAGQIAHINGNIYQVKTSGTTKATGSGPSGYPSGTTPASVFTGTISDGTAVWAFVSAGPSVGTTGWVVQDSYGYTLRINDSSLIDGSVGFLMSDTVNSGSSYPLFSVINDLEDDGAWFDDVELFAGGDVQMSNDYHDTAITNNGINVAPSFLGGLSIVNSIVSANAEHGLLIRGGSQISVVGGQYWVNGVAGPAGTYDNIVLVAGIKNFTIHDLMAGGGPSALVGTSQAGWGVLVNSGDSNYYTITGIVCGGQNVSGCVSDGGTGTHKTVSGNE